MTSEPGGGQGFRVRSLTTSVYLPNLLFAVGQGAAIPMIPLLALELGAPAALAGAVVALRGIGTMAFDVPAGVLVGRIGERRAMLAATGVLAVVALAVAARPPFPVYAGLVLLMGCAWSVWMLARLAYATESSPLGHRGRVMSIVGGVQRVGHFAGPLLGGAAAIPFGVAGPFYVQALMAVVASVALALAPEAEPIEGRREPVAVTMRGVLRDHRRVLATAGLAAVVIQVVRSSREAVLPLWGDRLGLGPTEISLIFGISSAIDMTVFYPVGMLMDRKGRKWAAIPSVSLLAMGIALVPFTDGFLTLAGAGLVVGLAHGLGSGLVMTLGSDLSPPVGRAHFLGLWRLVSDAGTAGGPLLVAAVTSAASLAAAAFAVGGVGALGALLLWRATPETLTSGRARPG